MNNFFLSMVSDLGINATFLFSLGALFFSITYYLQSAFKVKKETGAYWHVSKSNLFFECPNTGNTRLNIRNIRGLAIRTCFNISF